MKSVLKSILEDPSQHSNRIQNIKCQYLAAENNWMAQQTRMLSNLILLLKHQIQTLSDKNRNDVQNRKKCITSQLEEVIENLAHSNIWTSSKDDGLTIVESHCQLSTQEMWKMIFSFEAQIHLLKYITIKDEHNIQLLESSKENIYLFKEQIDYSPIMKTVQSYNIHHKVLEKYKRKITNLKIKKKTIQKQMALLAFDDDPTERTQCQLKDKASQFISELDQPVPKRNQQIVTSFESAILIYKKKKFLNQRQREKIIKLKLLIQAKKAIAFKLEQGLCENQWDNLNFSQFVAHHKDANNFSFVNSFTMNAIPKICQSFQFDQDVSRIMPSK